MRKKAISSNLCKGFCGRNEDPAENLFTTSVHCRTVNFVVLEGLREGNGFYLQRVLDVLQDMPDGEPFQSIRRAVFALNVWPSPSQIASGSWSTILVPFFRLNFSQIGRSDNLRFKTDH
jgi:hypothetical protein